MTSFAKGVAAEEEAVRFFTQRGYTLLERRYKTPVGEIDLVVFDGPLLVFVEVKRRPTLEDGLWALLPRQQRRLQEAATFFIQKTAHLFTQMRFDAFIVSADDQKEHVVNIFQ